MEVLSSLVFAVGIILASVGGIWCLVYAFKESILWGILSIIIPFVLLVFALMNLDKCKKPLGIWLAGVVLYVIGGFVIAADVVEQVDQQQGTTPPAMTEDE